AVLQVLDRRLPPSVQEAVDELLEQGKAVLASEGYADHMVDAVVSADLRYLGQSSELTVPVTGSFNDEQTIARLREDFSQLYEATFGYRSDETLELVNLRVMVSGRSERRLNFPGIRVDGSALAGQAGARMVSFDPDMPPC